MTHTYLPSQSNTRRSVKKHRRGFTIIELMVALGISALMIAMINRIFFDTTNAVSRGMGLSGIIGESRAFGTTVATDFTEGNVVQPSANGFMFLGFRNYTGIPYATPRADTYAPGTNPNVYSSSANTVISDQMLVVLDITADGRTPLTPRDDDSFNPYQSPATHALLWYGHVARLEPDGADAGELSNSVRNNLANQWVVGRQLMFLDNAIPAGVAHATGPYADSPVTGYTIPGPAYAPYPNPERFEGFTDLIDMSLAEISDPSPSELEPVGALTPLEYLCTVGRMAYAARRLRVASSVNYHNPVPPAPVNPALSFKSWNVAQTHPAFMSFCSDFQITFAGNFDATAGIDTEPAAAGTDVNGVAYTHVAGGIRWYGFPANKPGTATYNSRRPAVYDPTDPALLTNFNTAAPGAPYADNATNMLPVLEVMVDGPLLNLTGLQVDQGVVFRHDATDVTTQWPHLIRIRYRLHDERGEVESSNGSMRTQGIWFEQIVRIQ